ncbi:MAG: hypothetical protein JO333_21385 [Verrucomicrobia bacterium]|nr:hypothetical protein [Verrucomicrobiota bacterium]
MSVAAWIDGYFNHSRDLRYFRLLLASSPPSPLASDPQNRDVCRLSWSNSLDINKALREKSLKEPYVWARTTIITRIRKN